MMGFRLGPALDNLIAEDRARRRRLGAEPELRSLVELGNAIERAARTFDPGAIEPTSFPIPSLRGGGAVGGAGIPVEIPATSWPEPRARFLEHREPAERELPDPDAGGFAELVRRSRSV